MGAHALQEAERVPAVPTHILSMAFPFFTIGHSTRSVAELAGLLQQAGAGLLVDVRAIPRSRTNPQFNADALSESLAPWQIGYTGTSARSAACAGTPRTKARPRTSTGRTGVSGTTPTTPRPSRSASGWPSCAISAASMFCAIICAEAVWWRCHRRFIANYLMSEGERVFHIMGAGKIEPAVLSPAAVWQPDGTLVYIATSWLLQLKLRARAAPPCRSTARSNSSHATCFSME